jgi:hypothetical protein
MTDILSQNSKKKKYPKSVTGLLRLEEKRFVQDACYFINKGRATAQAVTCRLPTAVAQVETQVWSCGIL